MASDKFYPSIRGTYVLLLDYDGTWIPHCGANSVDKLKRERAKLSQWPDAKVRIASNVKASD